MKVILFGASGMVGQAVLRECLLDKSVERVLSIGRRASGLSDSKLRELIRPDLFDLSIGEAAFRVEPVAHRDELVEMRVHGAQRLRVLEVHLAPVRAPAVATHDRLDRHEVLGGVLPKIPVHGDVAGDLEAEDQQDDQ